MASFSLWASASIWAAVPGRCPRARGACRRATACRRGRPSTPGPTRSSRRRRSSLVVTPPRYSPDRGSPRRRAPQRSRPCSAAAAWCISFARRSSRRSCHADPEEHHTNLIYVSGVAELVCAAGLVRRTRWAPAPASPRWPPCSPPTSRWRSMPGRVATRPVGQPRRGLGPPPLQLAMAGGAPGPPRTGLSARNRAWRSGAPPRRRRTRRAASTCSTARLGPTPRLASSPRGPPPARRLRARPAVGVRQRRRGDPPRQGHRDVPLRTGGRRALPAARRGRALVERLAALARAAGCYGMWVVTDMTTRPPAPPMKGTVGYPRPGRSSRSGRSDGNEPARAVRPAASRPRSRRTGSLVGGPPRSPRAVEAPCVDLLRPGVEADGGVPECTGGLLERGRSAAASPRERASGGRTSA